MPYGKVSRREVKRVFGDSLQADIPLSQILAEAEAKFEIYSILPKLTSYFDDREVNDCWRELFGQRALRLKDPNGISELIASTIGLAEKTVKWRDLSQGLKGEGANRSVVRAVASALQGGFRN